MNETQQESLPENCIPLSIWKFPRVLKVPLGCWQQFSMPNLVTAVVPDDFSRIFVQQTALEMNIVLFPEPEGKISCTRLYVLKRKFIQAFQNTLYEIRISSLVGVTNCDTDPLCGQQHLPRPVSALMGFQPCSLCHITNNYNLVV